MKCSYVKLFGIILLLGLGAILPFASCSDSKVEKELDGRWEGEAAIVDEEGDMITFKMYLTLTVANNDFDMKINVIYPGIGKVAVIRFGGEWSANSNSLMLDVEEKSLSVRFDEDLAILAEMGGMNVGLLKRQMEQELKDEISGLSILDIKSLSKNEMTLDIFDTNGFFNKMENDYDTSMITIPDEPKTVDVDSSDYYPPFDEDSIQYEP